MTADTEAAAARERRHPLARLAGTVGRLPRYARLARRLLADPGLSRKRKLLVGAAVAYLASPIDLVPGLIPVAGQLDDIAAVLLALRIALSGLSADDARAHLDDVGLSSSAIDADLANVRAAAGWIGVTAAGAAGALLRAPVRLARIVGDRRLGRRRRPRRTGAEQRGYARSSRSVR